MTPGNVGAGTRIGPYEVLGALGAGGMGEVYRARDTKLNREVAIKILPAAVAGDPDRLARFRREAQLLASVNHPNIGQIYGFEERPSAGSGQADVHALVLELVEGPTLADLIESSGRVALADALAIARQIVDALEAAHALGIIHRDLKPANIKVRPDGTVKVLDFGLAKALGAEPASAVAGGLDDSPTITSPAMTQLGMILGTAAYMAPEQAKGRAVDKRADIWAFGCVLHEMLTGRRTFGGDDVSDTLANILKSEPAWTALPADTPSALRRLLRRCLSKDLSGRLSDIGVARLEIAEALASADPDDRPAAVPTAPSQPTLRRRWRDAALGVAGVALVAASPFVVTHVRETPPVRAAVRFVMAPPPGTGFVTNTSRTAVAVSPDGRLVVFRAQRPGATPTLWVRALDSLDARELRGTERGNVPFWSPDSRSIAFISESKLKRIDVAGGPVQTVCDMPAGRGGTWNQDGTIVFGGRSGGLARVEAIGGEAVVLTTPDVARNETVHLAPQFLPDGRRFLFMAQPGNVVYLGSLDSPDRTRLFEADSVVRYAPPGYLLFMREGTLMAREFDASRAAFDGDAVPIAELVRTVNLVGMPAGVFSVSDTGVLAYEVGRQEVGGRPVWVDRRGQESGPAAAGIADVHFPRLSPDGRRLAVIRGGDLWVEDLQGRPSIRLTFDGKEIEHFSPLWSPDGKQLVYETIGGSALLSLPADGSSRTPAAVSPTGHFHPHGWTNGGRDLISVRLNSVGTQADIVALPLDGKGEPRSIVETPADEGRAGAALSPDGRWLAYSANPTERPEIWVRPYPGPGAPVRVSPNGGVDPVWARNGSELYYYEGATRLMGAAVQPGADFRVAPPALLFEGAYLRGNQPPNYDVAPDGRFLMLKPPPTAEEPGSQPLTIVVNWVDELERRAQRR
jgi:hypothetical protein